MPQVTKLPRGPRAIDGAVATFTVPNSSASPDGGESPRHSRNATAYEDAAAPPSSIHAAACASPLDASATKRCPCALREMIRDEQSPAVTGCPDASTSAARMPLPPSAPCQTMHARLPFEAASSSPPAQRAMTTASPDGEPSDARGRALIVVPAPWN